MTETKAAAAAKDKAQSGDAGTQQKVISETAKVTDVVTANKEQPTAEQLAAAEASLEPQKAVEGAVGSEGDEGGEAIDFEYDVDSTASAGRRKFASGETLVVGKLGDKPKLKVAGCPAHMIPMASKDLRRVACKDTGRVYIADADELVYVHKSDAEEMRKAGFLPVKAK